MERDIFPKTEFFQSHPKIMDGENTQLCDIYQPLESDLDQILLRLISNQDDRLLGIYIFGIGQGGQALLKYLKELCSYRDKVVVKGFFDNNPARHGTDMDGVPIMPPGAGILGTGDLVLLASLDYCYEMNEQLFDLGVDEEKVIFPDGWLVALLPETQNTPVELLNMDISKAKAECPAMAQIFDYVAERFTVASSKSKEFVEYDETLCINLSEDDIKLIAFYLPQFHPIPENDKWWGRGFTEWTNVTKAAPQYWGHHQPQLPIDVGFYDLRNIEVMKRQAELARQYGIYGFCFHHYWFGGKRLLETPVNNLLAASEIKLPFCLCWANENWTRRWDGLNQEVLIAQNHCPEDDLAFIEDVAQYFKDSRYIRINGKPLFIVYRPMLFPQPQETVARWRDYCRRQGIGELFIIGVKAFGFHNPQMADLDATVEFPPNNLYASAIASEFLMMNPNFAGKIYDYTYAVKRKQYFKRDRALTFKTVMPGWDNTARRPNNPTIFHGSEPRIYQEWLEDVIGFTKRHLPQDNQFVFINAWNEWAEGAHLEPDRKYGYGNLQATANAVMNTRLNK